MGCDEPRTTNSDLDSRNFVYGVEVPREGLPPCSDCKTHNFDERDTNETFENRIHEYTGVATGLDSVHIARIKQHIAAERVEWPDPSPAALLKTPIKLYQACKQAAAHNMLGPRLVIDTANRLNEWSQLSTGHPDDPWILDGIYYGFPLQYRGPPICQQFTGNHPSAVSYPNQISEYIEKEIEYGGLLGPFDELPFSPWCHVAPIMTRPKSIGNQRRIIVDLTYPEGVGPNAHITKNHIFGCGVSHELPTVDDAIKIIISYEFRVVLAALDIARAYRNFALDPYDWPLTCVSHMGSYYIDVRMPFGSRLSSLHMQRVALFLQRALRALEVIALIYLDDVLLICPPNQDPDKVFLTARQLVRKVGLPIAWDKLVSPCKAIRFLGIIIDCMNKEIRIPRDKIDAFIQLARETRVKRFVYRKELQSIAGHINHLGKAVCAARLFMNRILGLLRAMKGRSIRVDYQLCRDLDWFVTFLPSYNGKSLIVYGPPSVYIEADSCLAGGGGWSGLDCYSYRYLTSDVKGWSISELEAYNCLLAARIFLSKKRNVSVQITCDNTAAVMSLSSGAARDKNILAVCRAFWFLAASNNLRFSFVHAPGETLTDADILSRRFLSDNDSRRADDLVKRKGLHILPVLPRFCEIDNYF